MNIKTKPFANPILILSDGADQQTGLARIARDLATILSTMPEFRVGWLGRGQVGRREFPWSQYAYPISGQWGEEYIQDVWQNFSSGDPGVIFSNWDPSRLHWFSQPHYYAQQNPGLAKFLGDGRDFAKWGYFPVDGTGPNGNSLGIGGVSAVAGFDRVIAASEWGERVLQAGGRYDADWLPHGFFKSKFSVQSYVDDNKSIVVGCVMSNQSRKDWPVAMQTAALLKERYGNKFKFWAHTDVLLNHWNIQSLIAEYGLSDCIDVTTELSDSQLRSRYSSCGATILPSGGEGFGFPIVESLACGTACIVTDYAAGPSLVAETCAARPIAMRLDTIHNIQRAVLSPYHFFNAAVVEIEKKRGDWDYRAEELAATVEHLEWDNLRKPWERWFREGLR